MLQATSLRKDYNGHTALENLNLHIKPGEIYCLLGANGAGKSTTINLFLDFIKPTAGEALVNGLNAKDHPIETKKSLAYIPEIVMLYRNLTGLENLRYFSGLAGHSHYTESDLIGFLRRAGLPDDAPHRRVGGYSKGMRQKVGIAIAIAKQAKALLLDEPTSGLDPKASNEFSALLTQLSREGVAILMATHDLFRAKETGTRAGIMRRGKLVADLVTKDIGHADLEKLYLDYMHD
ncbi:MAG: ABC transporter ATP-binding protein [Rhodospirillaceae bacterium]|nr:ABC transporter ATP-binding protein [Rhodospirillaceae bacterium]